MNHPGPYHPHHPGHLHMTPEESAHLFSGFWHDRGKQIALTIGVAAATANPVVVVGGLAVAGGLATAAIVKRLRR
jgi:hypothetical protein